MFNVEGPFLLVILVVSIVYIVFATAKLRLHPFIALLTAAFGVALASGLPIAEIDVVIRQGFGGILAYIGIIIVFGTIIGTILEKSGAAIVMADTVLKLLGKRSPTLAMSIIGYIISIPVFCDSGYVILNSLRKSVTRKSAASAVAMSIALMTGLYATHTLVPPTPGPIAAAANLNLTDVLGFIIIVGACFAFIATFVGWLWAIYCGKRYTTEEDTEKLELDYDEIKKQYGELPSTFKAFSPILIPVFLIALGSVASYPTQPLGDSAFVSFLQFLGKPFNALGIGLLFCIPLLPKLNEETLSGWIGEGIKASAMIILITGAGGAFGNVLKATDIGEYLGATLSALNLGILLPFLIAAALKTSQGSSTVALVTTSALVAPLLGALGLDSNLGGILTVMAIGAGAMTVSHANDSFFWVVTEFSKMNVSLGYRTMTLATMLQGLSVITVCIVVSFIFL